jgi:hypothetical protein
VAPSAAAAAIAEVAADVLSGRAASGVLARAAWLFLLPAGIIGWALLVTALGVLVGHWRKACQPL